VLIKSVLYGAVNKVENLLVKFDSFVKSDVLLTVRFFPVPELYNSDIKQQFD
jgi:hypothetical protein